MGFNVSYPDPGEKKEDIFSEVVSYENEDKIAEKIQQMNDFVDQTLKQFGDLVDLVPEEGEYPSEGPFADAQKYLTNALKKANDNITKKLKDLGDKHVEKLGKIKGKDILINLENESYEEEKTKLGTITVLMNRASKSLYGQQEGMDPRFPFDLSMMWKTIQALKQFKTASAKRGNHEEAKKIWDVINTNMNYYSTVEEDIRADLPKYDGACNMTNLLNLVLRNANNYDDLGDTEVDLLTKISDKMVCVINGAGAFSQKRAVLENSEDGKPGLEEAIRQLNNEIENYKGMAITILEQHDTDYYTAEKDLVECTNEFEQRSQELEQKRQDIIDNEEKRKEAEKNQKLKNELNDKLIIKSNEWFEASEKHTEKTEKIFGKNGEWGKFKLAYEDLSRQINEKNGLLVKISAQNEINLNAKNEIEQIKTKAENDLKLKKQENDNAVLAKKQENDNAVAAKKLEADNAVKEKTQTNENAVANLKQEIEHAVAIKRQDNDRLISEKVNENDRLISEKVQKNNNLISAKKQEIEKQVGKRIGEVSDISNNISGFQDLYRNLSEVEAQYNRLKHIEQEGLDYLSMQDELMRKSLPVLSQYTDEIIDTYSQYGSNTKVAGKPRLAADAFDIALKYAHRTYRQDLQNFPRSQKELEEDTKRFDHLNQCMQNCRMAYFDGVESEAYQAARNELKKALADLDTRLIESYGTYKSEGKEIPLIAANIEMYKNKINSKSESITNISNEVNPIKKKLEAELEELQRQCNDELTQLQNKCNDELTQLQNKCNVELTQLQSNRNLELTQLQTKCNDELTQLQNKYREELDQLTTEGEKALVDLKNKGQNELISIKTKAEENINKANSVVKVLPIKVEDLISQTQNLRTTLIDEENKILTACGANKTQEILSIDDVNKNCKEPIQIEGEKVKTLYTEKRTLERQVEEIVVNKVESADELQKRVKELEEKIVPELGTRKRRLEAMVYNKEMLLENYQAISNKKEYVVNKLTDSLKQNVFSNKESVRQTLQQYYNDRYDAKRKSHTDSDEFVRMNEKLDAAVQLLSGKGEKKPEETWLDAQKRGLRELKEATSHYLTTRADDWWVIVPTTMRKQRLRAANSLKEYADRVLKDIEIQENKTNIADKLQDVKTKFKGVDKHISVNTLFAHIQALDPNKLKQYTGEYVLREEEAYRKTDEYKMRLAKEGIENVAADIKGNPAQKNNKEIHKDAMVGKRPSLDDDNNQNKKEDLNRSFSNF